MTSKLNLTKIISLVLVLVVFGGMIYGVSLMIGKSCPNGTTTNEKRNGRCEPNCDTTYPYYDAKSNKCLKCDKTKNLYPTADGKCVEKCADKDETDYCGNKCFDPYKNNCTDYNTLCSIDIDCEKIYIDEDLKRACCSNCVDGDGICCPDGHAVIDGKCQECGDGETVCGGGCCNGECCKNKNCCKNILDVCTEDGTCCDSSNVYINTDGTKECCKNGLSKTQGCCSPGETISDGLCVKTCGNEICYPKGDKDGKNKSFCKETAADGKGIKYWGCSLQDCVFDSPMSYDPATQYPVSGYKESGIPVCNGTGTDNGKLYYCNNEDGKLSNSTLELNVKMKTDSESKCNKWSCWNNAAKNETGVFDIQFNENTDGNSAQCTGKIDCKEHIYTKVKCSDYDRSNMNTSAPDSAFCKDNKGKHTGQLCPANAPICTDNGECIKGFSVTRDGPYQWKCTANNTEGLNHYTSQECLNRLKSTIENELDETKKCPLAYNLKFDNDNVSHCVRAPPPKIYRTNELGKPPGQSDIYCDNKESNQSVKDDKNCNYYNMRIGSGGIWAKDNIDIQPGVDYIGWEGNLYHNHTDEVQNHLWRNWKAPTLGKCTGNGCQDVESDYYTEKSKSNKNNTAFYNYDQFHDSPPGAIQ